jgi:hypothetical protein
MAQFPGKRRFQEQPAVVPEMDVGGKHKIDVLVVPAGEQGIEAAGLD